MKIALLLTGQLRTWRMCKYLFKNMIIDKYNTDVFLSIDMCNKLQCLHKNDSNVTTSIEVNDATSFFKPIKYFVSENYNKEFELVKKNINKSVEKYVRIDDTKLLFEQYFIVMNAYKLLKEHISETGVKYDIVIRLRFDQYIWTSDTSRIISDIKKYNNDVVYDDENIVLLDSLTQNMILDLDTMYPNTINLFNFGDFQSHGYKYANDQFFTHDHDMIEVMSDFYRQLPSLLNACASGTFPNHGCIIEHMFYNFLMNNKITMLHSKIRGIFVRSLNKK